MNKENEPILSDFTIPEDDLAQRQRQMQVRKAVAARSAAAPTSTTPSTPENSAERAAPAKQTLATFAFILVLCVAGVAAFLFVQLQAVQQKMLKAETLLQSQSENLNILNEKLSVTGENANLSLDALRVMLKDQDSEIRKLWELANKRNRGAIEANSKNIADLKTAVDKTGSAQTQQIQKQQQELADLHLALDKRFANVEGQLGGLAEVDLRLAQQAESIQALNKELAKLKKNGLGVDVNALRLQVEDLKIRFDRLQNGAAK